MEEHCGIIGYIGPNPVSNTINSLKKLQHRGYEGSGIAYYDKNNKLDIFKNFGLVKDIYKNFKTDNLDSSNNICLGHLRYSTRKQKDNNTLLYDVQPFIGNLDNLDNLYNFNKKQFALVHNGNIPRIDKIAEKYKSKVYPSDTFTLVKLIEKIYLKYNDLDKLMKWIVNSIPPSFSLIIMVENCIYVLKDKCGIRPLCVGRLNNNICVSSETVGLPDGFILDKFVDAGEVLRIDIFGRVKSIYKPNITPSFCSFEYVYFMHFKSHINKKGDTVSDLRYGLGYELGKSLKDEVDPKEFPQVYNGEFIITPVPNSSIPMAKGFSQASGIKYVECLIKNKSIKRTFIIDNQEEREKVCKKKFKYLKDFIKGKNIILIDDSIVRGTTMSIIIKSLKEYKAKSIHIVVMSPPVISPCYFGIDMSTDEELIASSNDIDKITKQLGADSVTYYKLDEMVHVFEKFIDNFKVNNFCISCFTGNYDQLLDW